MKRQLAGLCAADRCAPDQIPDGVFLVRVLKVSFRRQAPKPYYTVTLTISRAQSICGPHGFKSHLLQPESTLEAELVSAGLWLRCRTARTG